MTTSFPIARSNLREPSDTIPDLTIQDLDEEYLKNAHALGICDLDVEYAVAKQARIDTSRLIHSPSFRRLNKKRQILESAQSDFVRVRLTHSEEVAAIAIGIAERLNEKLRDVDYFCDASRLSRSEIIETLNLRSEHDGGRKLTEAELPRVFKKYAPSVDLDVVRFAGVAHDLGHPPFDITVRRRFTEPWMTLAALRAMRKRFTY